MATPPQTVQKIKKGEMLFNEGDISKSMYFIQSGTIRLFKKKGNTSIELGLIHKGEVIGEMGFLDGGPRSASAEAIHDTDLVEITNNNLTEQMKVLPPWLMVLLKTIVNRLRSANNKIRQLETASTAYTYGGEGVSTTYQFLNVYDVLKICTSALLCASRYSEKVDGGHKVTMQKINKYANQIIGIHVTKITEMLDILERVGMCKIDRTVPDKIEMVFTDLETLDLLTNYMNEENLKDHTKKTTFSIKAVIVMGYMVKYLDKYPANAEGISEINLASIIETEKTLTNGKEPFRLDESIQEIVKAKLCTELSLKDANNVLTKTNGKLLSKMFKVQKVIKEIDIINDKKREQASRGAQQRR